MNRKKIIASILIASMMISAVSMTSFAAAADTDTTVSNSQDAGTPPAMPDGQAPSDMDGTPPSKPDGEEPGGDNSDGQPPEMPDGETPGGQAPGGQAPGGQGEAPDGQAPGEMGGGQSSGVDSYTTVTEFSEDTETSDETYDSTGTDENAIHVSGGTVTLNNPTVTRNSSDSTGGDNSSFYGVGAAVLTTGGQTYIDGGNITTDAAGGAGVFSYGSGVTYIRDAVISTGSGTSGGIHVAGGGTLYAWDLDVTTEGESSAAIRSDRGSGTMVVDGGTYTSNGTGSPAIYSTADITVNDADLTANGSEAICIEGLNTIRLFDCDLTGNMPENDQNDVSWNVIVYQSMSGDSAEGNGTFEMHGGTLTAQNGGMFYTTNTESTFYLENVDITYSDDNPFFLQVTGNSNARGWGSSGSNGADCNFTAVNQVMEGDIIYDSISNLDFYMQNGSTLTGAFIDDETWAGDTEGSGYANLYISSDSTWVVTGNSVLSALYSEGTIVDEDGNTVSVIGEDGTVYVEGNSEFTVTVGEYSESADFSDAASGSSFENYAVAWDGTAQSGLTDASSEETVFESEAAESLAAADTETSESKGLSKGAIAGIAAAAVAVCGGAAALILKKKKNK